MVRELAAYRDPDLGRSLKELLVTLGPFVGLMAAMFAAVAKGWWVALFLALPAGGLLLRLFLIQHDCGHGAFLARRSANDWLGRCLGVMTFTPYACWRRAHALHHATTGSLERRGSGDVDTLTVKEYEALGRWGKIGYRTYRHPLVLFGVGPTYLFLIRHRLPIGLMRAGASYWMSALGTNAMIGLIALGLIGQVGLVAYLAVHLPVVLIAASIGVSLFYIQHQFERTHWAEEHEWSFHEAALYGSSNLQLPPPFRWFTANVGMHHVHHLASRIPFYRLPEVLKNQPRLSLVNRIGWKDVRQAIRLALWDEDRRLLVSFAGARSDASSARS